MTQEEFLKLGNNLEMKIKFKGNNYLLIGGGLQGWAIATREQYHEFLPSYAHLFGDGRILRYQKQIGTYKDITVGKKTRKNKKT